MAWNTSAHSRFPGVSELVTAQANFRTQSVIFASVYLAPKNRYCADKFVEWLDALSNWLASLGPEVHSLVLMGDFNLAPGEANFTRLFDVLCAFGLTVILNEPTHGGNGITRRQLDHIFVGAPLLGGKCHLAPLLEKNVTGHSFILFSPISICATKHRSSATSLRLFKNTDIPKAQFKLLFSRDGEPRNLTAEVSAKASVDEAAEFLICEISAAFRESTPLSKIPAQRCTFLWIRRFGA